MDPEPLLNAEWTEIGRLITYLWFMVACVVVAAGSMLVGHAAIPSLVESGHLPARAQRLRPACYALALAAFGVGLVLLVSVVDLAGVLRRFYPVYWI